MTTNPVAFLQRMEREKRVRIEKEKKERRDIEIRRERELMWIAKKAQLSSRLNELQGLESAGQHHPERFIEYWSN